MKENREIYFSRGFGNNSLPCPVYTCSTIRAYTRILAAVAAQAANSILLTVKSRKSKARLFDFLSMARSIHSSINSLLDFKALGTIAVIYHHFAIQMLDTYPTIYQNHTFICCSFNLKTRSSFFKPR